ncbi:camp-dependent protein kinase [Nesidiocoris tenuis]|uniref:Camp-dependent protein kinase n=1 Tax=Nesidiocoris tenuis TaxID=355587 RepID=A0ABN7AU60_9HEMI|nr:camp-dependent protein kinase [Nesidiocoris tenuis]
MSSPARLTLPKEIQNTLLNFAAGYLSEKPNDPDQYALTFFQESSAYQKHSQETKEEEKHTDDTNKADTIFALELKCMRNDVRRNAVYHSNQSIPPVKMKSSIFNTYEKLKIGLVLKKLFPFRTLDEKILEQIADRVLKIEVIAGDTVIRQGDEYLNFFIIESGIYEEWITTGNSSSLLFSYDSFGSFGNASLIFPHVAVSTIIAKTCGALWVLSCAEYQSMVREDAMKKLELKYACIEKWPYVRTLRSKVKEKLVDGIQELHLKRDESFVNPSLFFVASGRIEIRNITQGRIVSSKILKEGESYEKLFPFFNRWAGNRAVALENTQILYLPVDAFKRLVGSFTEIVFSAEGEFLKLVSAKRSKEHAALKELRKVFVKFHNSKSKNFINFGLKYYENKLGHRCSQTLAENIWPHSDRGDCDNLRIRYCGSSENTLTYTIEEKSPCFRFCQRIKKILKTIPIFSVLEASRIKKIIAAMRPLKTYPGHYVTKIGNHGEHFYIIEEGKFQCFVNYEGVRLEIQDGPRYFGELGLVWDGPRFADVVAVSEGKIWALSRENYRKIALSRQPVGTGLNFKLVKSAVNHLKSLQEHDIKAILLSMKNLNFKDRELVHSFDQDSCCAYFIRQGTVRIHADRPTRIDSVLTNGQLFGNVTFTIAKTEPMEVQSIGNSTIAKLNIDSFEKLLAHCRTVIYTNKS